MSSQIPKTHYLNAFPDKDLKLLVKNLIHLGLVVQKLINTKPRLKVNEGVYFSTPSCCLTLLFGKPLY